MSEKKDGYKGSEVKDTSYNGWKNYETWVTKLWLDNEKCWYEYQQRLLKSARKGAKEDRHEVLTEDEQVSLWIADALKAVVEDEILFFHKGSKMVESSLSGLAQDLIGAALCEVDFREIAENIMSDDE